MKRGGETDRERRDAREATKKMRDKWKRHVCAYECEFC